ncbi:EamA family transporter RarD [Ammoniphilus sp. CFH 90114]|uniref:EamA family transporter RarD n=1 Tax=Ammoniphilus sp. CFH 90114 TaxID=2493665 RepID=UPI00100EC525|nr:EamA family transporter RarD [Ammoniphilus sp. CFH 90114]RXT02306.1 EamA family transporter RarD [Ammoniphilus sp. CFH 90114]
MNREVTGIWYAVAAYASWGLLPLYWKALQQIPSGEILAHRILWSFVFVSMILFLMKRWKSFKEVLFQPSVRLGIFASGFLISANWFTYIWAVNNNHVIEASLGYYINPLLSFCLGMLVLKERLHFWQLVSIALAAIGVIIITVEFGKIPWVAFSLALTFAFYGLAKKLTKVDSMISLALETTIVAPLAILYLSFLQWNGSGALGTVTMGEHFLLFGAGIVTALPLLWFAQAAKRISLTTIGFIQYLSPSIGLLLGIFLYKEPFTTAHIISFSFIWAALLLYSISSTKFMVQITPKFQRKL